MHAKEFTDWLRALELAQVAVTATIDPQGRLGAVGGLWPKLLAASQEAVHMGLLRMVVVATEQADVAPDLLAVDAAPLRVLRAATLQDAISALYEEHGPREAVRKYEREHCANMDLFGGTVRIDAHYQVLPLLRAIKRERLPRAVDMIPHARAPHAEEANFQSLSETDLLRWEEELREERIAYEPTALTDLFQQFSTVTENVRNATPRFVVLGPPGSGKTSLVQYLGWQAANHALHVAGRVLLPARVRLRDWEAWATREGTLEPGLPQYLAIRYQALVPAPNAAQWRLWLQRGDVCLLLDGLDEIDGKPFFLSALKTALLTFPTCPTVLTCRTVSFEQHRAVSPDFPIFTLAGLTAEQQHAAIRAFPTMRQNAYSPEVLIEQLDRTPHLRSLSANPLLLGLLCYAMENAGEARLPSTRGALYTRVLKKLLLTRPQRVEVRYPGEEPTVDEKLALMQRAALFLFLQDDYRLTFTGQALGRALQQALSAEHYGSVWAPWANALRTDFTQNSGVLRHDTDHGFFFLHLTIQEFLVAKALAEVINHQGWDAGIDLSGQQVSPRRLLDAKAWEPRWQEVILLLAGQLTDPTPLLQLLMDKKKDDLFGSRLALAVHCLSETPRHDDASLSPLVDRLTFTAYQLWLRHARTNTTMAVRPLTRALPALGQKNGNIHGAPLLQWLCQQLRHQASDVRAVAAAALNHMGEVIAQHPEVIAALTKALHDPEINVRAEAVEALRGLGDTVARHENALSALADVAQHDTDGTIRFAARRTLHQLAEAAAWHPAVSFLLTADAGQDKPEASRSVPQKAEDKEATTASLPMLLTRLRDGDSHGRARAAHELAMLGKSAAQQPEVVSRLLEVLLYDRDAGVRARAIAALGSMGNAPTQHPRLIPALIVAMRDRDDGVRAQAAKTLGKLGETAARAADVLPALVAALRDDRIAVRYRAAEALALFADHGVRIFRRWWGKIEGALVRDLAKI